MRTCWVIRPCVDETSATISWCAAVWLACLLLVSTPISAQTFVELAGGLNYVANTTSGVRYSSGSNLRASVGWRVAPTFSWRIDALSSQFDVNATTSQPCPSSGCSGPGYAFKSERVSGVSVNGLVTVDTRGIFYVIAGAGLYDVRTQKSMWNVGVSGGAGIAVPITTHLRAVVEARWHGILGSTPGAPWFMPITFGLRY